MPRTVEWTAERARGFGVAAVTFGVLGALQVIPVVGSIAAISIAAAISGNSAAAGHQGGLRAARIAARLGYVGLVVSVIAATIYFARR